MKKLTLLYLINNDQVLLAMKKRGFGVGHWNGVGGKVEPGESTVEAMIRESQEEICVTPSSYQKIAEIIFHEEFQGSYQEMHVSVFTCNEWIGEPMETEEMAPKWFNKNALPFKEMWSDDQFWLSNVLNGNKLKAEFWHDVNNNIINKKISLGNRL